MSPRLLLIAAFVLAAAIAAPAGAAERSPRAKARKTAQRAADRGVPYAANEAALQWADELAQRRGLDREWVRDAISQARFLPAVAKLMQPAPAGTAKNWRVYRSRFIDATRIAAGVRFWQDNRDALERAQARYGVPPEIIVGIVGVETIYGQQMGTFRVLDALATLAFDFPANHPRAAERSAYFRGELEQFLVLQWQRGGDAALPVGSYAGAMGMPQFMPTSFARWAVDFDGDGRIDLSRSAADVIGSVANYFNSYGWKPGMPTHYPVSFDPARLDLDALLAPDILPTFSVASFTAKGAVLEGAALQHPGPLALVELQNGDAPPQYVAGTENFYVITRYNWSSYYAMAVIELGQVVKDAVEALSAAQAARAPSVPADLPAAAAPTAATPATTIPVSAGPASTTPASTAPTTAQPEPTPLEAAQPITVLPVTPLTAPGADPDADRPAVIPEPTAKPVSERATEPAPEPASKPAQPPEPPAN